LKDHHTVDLKGLLLIKASKNLARTIGWSEFKSQWYFVWKIKKKGCSILY